MWKEIKTFVAGNFWNDPSDPHFLVYNSFSLSIYWMCWIASNKENTAEVKMSFPKSDCNKTMTSILFEVSFSPLALSPRQVILGKTSHWVMRRSCRKAQKGKELQSDKPYVSWEGALPSPLTPSAAAPSPALDHRKGFELETASCSQIPYSQKLYGIKRLFSTA